MSERSSAEIHKPQTDDRPLWDVVFGVYGYPAILLAHKLKVFPLLAESSHTLAEICTALKIARRPAAALLTAATALGFLSPHDERYHELAPTPLIVL
jgi:hypothetical protein